MCKLILITVLLTISFGSILCDSSIFDYFLLRAQGSQPISVFKNVTLVICTVPPQPEDGTAAAPGKKEIVLINADNSLEPYLKNYLDEETEIEIHGPVNGLPASALEKIVKLKKLVANRNGLKGIEHKIFNDLTHLEMVDLSFNELKEVNNDIFTSTTIKDLILRDNHIRDIHERAFQDMKNLQRLDLSNNEIIKWDRDWCLNSPLSELSLSGNAIRDLEPNNFNYLKPGDDSQTISIDLSENRIAQIPIGTFHSLPNIDKLILAKNYIISIEPAAFGDTEKINLLDLSSNQLEDIEGDVFNGTMVDTLDLNDNMLPRIPMKFIDEKIVRVITLDNNPLKCSFLNEVKEGIKNKEELLKQCK